MRLLIGRGSLMTAARYWRSDRSWLYIRSRDSDSPNATAPISRPTTVTLKATRRSWLSSAVLPAANPVSAGESGISVPISPSAGPARTSMRVRGEAALGIEVEVGERLVELVLAPGRARVLDDERQCPAIAGLRATPLTAAQAAARSLSASASRAPRPHAGGRRTGAGVAGRHLDHVAAELEDDQREREQRQDQDGHLEGARDVEDRLVDAVAAECEKKNQGASERKSAAGPQRAPAAAAPELASGAESQQQDDPERRRQGGNRRGANGLPRGWSRRRGRREAAHERAGLRGQTSSRR